MKEEGIDATENRRRQLYLAIAESPCAYCRHMVSRDFGEDFIRYSCKLGKGMQLVWDIKTLAVEGTHVENCDGFIRTKKYDVRKPKKK